MISKVIKPAKSFARICQYLLKNREQARVIISEGVRDYDHHKMATDFELQAGSNPNLASPVQHIILAFAPGEEIEEEKHSQIARDYLLGLQLHQTQFVVVSHKDKKHEHLHIVLNRVGNDGKTIKDNFLGLRGKKMAQALTQTHGLKPAICKNLKQSHLGQMNPYDRTRYEIYETIRKGLSISQDFHQLEAYLKKQQITLIYKFKGKTREIQGLSFAKGEFRYKGSEIDRRFSYGNLKRFYKHDLQIQRTVNPEQLLDMSEKEKTQIMDLLDILLKPQEVLELLPREWLLKKKRKKSKGLSL